MNSKILKAIKQKIQDRVARKELHSLFIDPEEIKSFNDCVSSIKRDGISLEESSELETIYKGLDSIFSHISDD
ncbi:hypothetical protein JSQ73_002095 [Wolbachia endosymbiont of Anopheles demeilloni]|uniref:hypothetical protein n=1 Tax=Wolbachia endosymbiont of Anopheles demeilloni TaxID=2748871 RepID=UPI001F2C69DE|nr:hypothetical protein [Wolbachia endosymbiont of Anopheles demeilloni]UIP93128.1 hypothetical protein JSQ73_002095 [Wolbachia endosymbiont of Anopheles demeilloni]